MSQTVTLFSESFVITCLLSLNTWNFRMLGDPTTKQKNSRFHLQLFCAWGFAKLHLFQWKNWSNQRTKKLMTDSPGLVDFAVGLVDFMGKWKFWVNFFFWGNSFNSSYLRESCWASENYFRASTSWLQLAQREAGKLKFFVPWSCMEILSMA